MWMERLCDATWPSCPLVSRGLGRNESSAAHNYGDGELAGGQKFLRFSHPGLDDIRRLAGRLFEQPGQVIATHAHRLSNPGNS
jgi:hypothetical protein